MTLIIFVADDHHSNRR